LNFDPRLNKRFLAKTRCKPLPLCGHSVEKQRPITVNNAVNLLFN
jgi:hypothetical protein